MRDHVRVAPSFFCLLALLIFLDTENLFLIFFFAAAVHECGHVVAIRLCGGSIRSFRLSGTGGEIRYMLPVQSSAREVLIALSGCLFGGALSAIAILSGRPLLCGASTMLTLFNLLPIPFLDGGRALELAFGKRAVLKLLADFTIGVLLCFGAVSAYRWHAFGLLFISVFLALRQQTVLHQRANRGMI